MPKVVDHEAYRCQLLRESFDVVANAGYGSLSMKQLARSLNISPGLIYHYFDSKEDWFVSLVAFLSKETFDELSHEISQGATFSERTELLAANIERHSEHYANMIRVASDYIRMPKVEEQGGMLQLSMAVDRLCEHIAMLFEADETTARALVSYLVGAIMASRLDSRCVDTRESLPVMRKLLNAPEQTGQGDVR